MPRTWSCRAGAACRRRWAASACTHCRGASAAITFRDGRGWTGPSRVARAPWAIPPAARARQSESCTCRRGRRMASGCPAALQHRHEPRRMARPMVALARLPGPNTLLPAFMRSCRHYRARHQRAMAAPPVELIAVCRLKRGSNMASQVAAPPGSSPGGNPPSRRRLQPARPAW